jgi:hypothetical protein
MYSVETNQNASFGRTNFKGRHPHYCRHAARSVSRKTIQSTDTSFCYIYRQQHQTHTTLSRNLNDHDGFSACFLSNSCCEEPSESIERATAASITMRQLVIVVAVSGEKGIGTSRIRVPVQRTFSFCLCSYSCRDNVIWPTVPSNISIILLFSVECYICEINRNTSGTTRERSRPSLNRKGWRVARSQIVSVPRMPMTGSHTQLQITPLSLTFFNSLFAPTKLSKLVSNPRKPSHNFTSRSQIKLSTHQSCLLHLVSLLAHSTADDPVFFPTTTNQPCRHQSQSFPVSNPEWILNPSLRCCPRIILHGLLSTKKDEIHH